MTALELKSALEELGISNSDFARLVEVTPRAVNLWITESREFSGPAVAYLRLFRTLPRAIQMKELARVRKEDEKMFGGMYSFQFQGAQGSGVGALVLMNGRAFGSDTGVLYDGTYSPSSSVPGAVDVKMNLTVPPGVALVQGVPPQPVTYNFDIDCRFYTRGSTALAVQTPFGLVNGTVTFLREVPN